MRTRLLALAAVLSSAVVASAGPLPWAYYVRVNAPDGFDGVLLGSELKPPATDGGPAESYSHIWDTGMGNYGMVRIHYETATGTETLFTLSPGFEQSVQSLPAGKSFAPGVLQVSWGFTPWGGMTDGVGSTTGTISSSGLFSSGTGNYVIGLDHEETMTLGGRTAAVRFHGVNTESGSRIDMTVTELAGQPPGVPEPGTIILGGIAVAGGLAAWRRRPTPARQA